MLRRCPVLSYLEAGCLWQEEGRRPREELICQIHETSRQGVHLSHNNVSVSRQIASLFPENVSLFPENAALTLTELDEQ